MRDVPASQRVRRVPIRSFVTEARSESPRRIVVTAAVIEQDGMFLVTRRPAGVHLEGLWEFPGGKCEEGESHAASLEREIAEELDAGVTVGAEILTVSHAYPDRTIELHFFECRLAGAPRAVLGQEMKWVRREDLRSLPFPPADEALILRLSTFSAS
jgi:8-oxo-dGTP diphosphatase